MNGKEPRPPIFPTHPKARVQIWCSESRRAKLRRLARKLDLPLRVVTDAVIDAGLLAKKKNGEKP